MMRLQEQMAQTRYCKEWTIPIDHADNTIRRPRQCHKQFLWQHATAVISWVLTYDQLYVCSETPWSLIIAANIGY